MGIPFSAVTVAARSSARFSSAVAKRRSTAARSVVPRSRQSSERRAERAAPTAESTSSDVDSGTIPIACSVTGEITGMVAEELGGCQRPPMNSLVRVVSIAGTVMSSPEVLWDVLLAV